MRHERPQTDWRGSASIIEISDLVRKSEPMRTQTNLCERYFLVEEEGFEPKKRGLRDTSLKNIALFS